MNYKMTLTALAVMGVLSACSTSKNFAYLQDMEPGQSYDEIEAPEARVQVGDKLNILVSCKNPELAIPFNTQSGAYRMQADGNVAIAEQGTQSLQGYRVDKDGNIVFPIFGKLKAEGLTLTELSEKIKQQIIDEKYIQDPMVTVEFMNFKIYLLGEVGKVGPLEVENGKITLLEAISMAGDLTAKARANKVKVIRTENGKKQVYVNDVRSSALLQSPTFYLKQNDVVYVEPKYKASRAEDSGFKYASLLLSIVSVLTTIFYYFK